jgi:hypothetical protein
MAKKLKTLSPSQRRRRESALTRLEAQLKSGVKKNDGDKTSLSDSDKKRIGVEIQILKTKLNHD